MRRNLRGLFDSLARGYRIIKIICLVPVIVGLYRGTEKSRKLAAVIPDLLGTLSECIE